METTLLPEEHSLVCKGDIAYNMMRMWQGASGRADQDGIISPAYVVLAPKQNIDSRYAAHLFKSKRMIFLFWAFSYGITGDRLRLYPKDVLKIPVTLPDLIKQRHIAAILTTWDRAIATTEALIAAKEKRKKALMQRLLTGKVRFREFAGQEWRTYRLGQLFKHRNERGRGDLPLVSITMANGVVPRSEIDKKDSSNDDKTRYLHICPGDVGYNTMRMWQGVSGISIIEGIVSPAYTICIPGPKVDAGFIGHFFKFTSIVHKFYCYSQGLVSDTWNLKFKHFSQIKVTIPSIEEQRVIAGVLSSADKELAAHRIALNALKEQKKGLMQQLLTGKVRVRT
ncbi:MAG: restriction endonuclease subunit S [Desulfovibrionaceae bacterium]